MKFKRFTKKNLSINALVIGVYLLFLYALGNLKQDAFILIAVWLTLFYAMKETRKKALGFANLFVLWIVYNSLHLVPNYTVSAIHIKEPYDIEKLLFGFEYLGNIVTPNEYYLENTIPILDFLTGLFYINWVSIPIAFGLYLYVKNKELFLKYSYGFFFVNLVGFAGYYVYPAAPPWYVQDYGFDLFMDVKGSCAGFLSFDAIIGIPVFESIYNKNANVLAAMPSLHSAFPVVVLFYAFKSKVGKFTKLFFFIFLLGIWFAAVYSSHHYIIDVIAGFLVAIITLLILDYFTSKSFFQEKIKNYAKLI